MEKLLSSLNTTQEELAVIDLEIFQGQDLKGKPVFFLGRKSQLGFPFIKLVQK
jgi:hypothetical protein